MGEVDLTEPSEMIGRLVCTTFTNRGRYEGNATVYGAIRLVADSLTTGELNARALAIDHGATFRGKVAIHPRPKVIDRHPRRRRPHPQTPLPPDHARGHAALRRRAVDHAHRLGRATPRSSRRVATRNMSNTAAELHGVSREAL